jgi:hypothetical protein
VAQRVIFHSRFSGFGCAILRAESDSRKWRVSTYIFHHFGRIGGLS